MMTTIEPWDIVETDERLAIAVSNFEPNFVDGLPLLIGDSISVERSCKDWLYGSFNGRFGVFPRTCVKHVPSKNNDETMSAIISEVRRTTSQWIDYMQDFFSIHRQHDVTKRLELIIKDLIHWRKQILSGKLPVEELSVLRKKIGVKIDVGNKLLDLDMVLRNDDGELADIESCGILELYQLHCSTLEKIQSDNKRGHISKEGLYQQQNGSCCCFLLCLHDIFLRVNSDAELFISLYDSQHNCYISLCKLLRELFTSYVPLLNDDERYGSLGSLSSVVKRSSGVFQGYKVLFTDFERKNFDGRRIFLVCKVIKFGAFEGGTLPRKATNTAVRQPYAVGVVDLSEIIKTPSKSFEECLIDGFASADECDTHVYMPLQTCDAKVEETLSKLLESKSCSSLSTASASIQSPNGIVSEHEQGIKLSIQQLWGTAEEVQNAHPSYFGQPPIIVRKLGFPEVISKDDVRNDLYVTLIGGDFKESNKSNIEVKAVLVDESGNALFENFVSVSAATRKETCFTSTVFYHDSKPKWNDMFKIVFPADRCDQLHIRFTFKHRSSSDSKDKSEKAFALAYIRLVQKNGTALKDGEHVLNLFKCEKRWEESPNAVSYLNLPSDRQESGGNFGSENSICKSSNVQNGAFILLTKDYFVIRTTMCSTSLTQNVELLGLLEWKLKPINLKSSLESLMKQDNDKIGADIINFLQDILDVIFGILTTSNDYDESAFDALVYVIGLVDERRFHSFKPVMDNYLNEKFSAGLVHMKLIRILNNYLNEFDRRTNQLFCALKSLEYLIKFVVKSRKIHMKLRCHNYKDEDFKDLLRKTPLLVASLFKKQTDSHDEKFKLTLKCLGAALKYFPMVVDELSAVFDPKELSVELTEILVNVPPKLMMQGLRFVESLINSNVFVRQECRLLLLPCFLRLLKNCIVKSDELDLSASVILGLFGLLYGQNSTCKPDNCDVENIVGILLRPVMQLIVRMSDSSPPNKQDVKLKYVAILIAILDKLTACSYSNYIKRFGHSIDLADFLTEMFMLIKDLVENCQFAPDWFHMIVVQNSVFLKILSFAAETVRLRFTDPSRNVQCSVYKDFFQTCVAFIIQKHLQPKMALNKRKLTNKKDLRLACANEIKALWTKMDAFRKSEFIPKLVGPILCVTLISYPELRRSTIPLFLDMIATTLCPSINSPKKVDTLKDIGAPLEKYLQFEREFISQLDILVDSGYGDEHYADAFISIMNDLLPKHKDNKIRKMGDRLVDIVRRLMRRLLEYRDVKQNHDCIDNRLSCIFKLMEFYKEIEQVELYVRYCYKLYHLHLQAGNFVEAAWSLKLHADLLQWKDIPVPQQLEGEDGSSQEHSRSQRELKEHLYDKILASFDSGQQWEKAIEICKEMQYQFDLQMDYVKMGDLLRRMAQFYDNIINLKRAEPEHFYVLFCGKDFPAFLQKRSFIYRGQPFERIGDFNNRMVAQYPKATISSKWEEPSDAQLSSQILYIRKVDPMIDEALLNQFPCRSSNSHVNWFFKYNNVQKFSFTRRIENRDDKQLLTGPSNNEREFMIWLEQTVLVTKAPFPAVLRFLPVVSTEKAQLSPVKVALDNMKISIHALQQCVEDFERSSNVNTEKLLAPKIQGIISAAVMGGITNYEKTIFTEEYKRVSVKNEEHLILEIKDLIASQIPLLEKGLFMLLKYGNAAQLPFYEHLLQSFESYKKDIESKYGSKQTLLSPHVDLRMLLSSSSTSSPVASVQKTSHFEHQMSYNQLPGTPVKPSSKHNSFDSPFGTGLSTSSITGSLSRLPMSSLWSNRTIGGTIPRKGHNKRKQSHLSALNGTEKDSNVSNGKRLSNASIESSHSIELINNSSPSSRIVEISEELTTQRPSRPTSANKKSYRCPSQRQASFVSHAPESCFEDNAVSGIVINYQDSRETEKPPALPPRCASQDLNERSHSFNNSSNFDLQRQISANSSVLLRKDKPLMPAPTNG